MKVNNFNRQLANVAASSTGGAAGGDLGGSFPAPTVGGIGGAPISGTPTAGDGLQYDGSAYTYQTLLLTPLTTAGDIWVYSTSDARLPVGSDGETLYADSAQTTGLRWGVTGVGAILISDTPSTPLVFADLIQNEAQDDLVYADF